MDDAEVSTIDVGEPRSGALECVARVASPVLDGLLFESETHWFVFWTMDVEERRAVVAMEARPRGKKGWRAVLGDWVLPRLKEYEAQPPRAVALPATALRHEISYREVMRARAEHLSQVSHPQVAGFDYSVIERGDVVGLDRSELKRLENLLDAVLYDSAVRANRSPVKAIAERRCISTRTAEGRIARARAMGFLTPAHGRRASGGLSDQAHDLLARLQRFGAVIEEGSR